mgnify:CR=1 FL=1
MAQYWSGVNLWRRLPFDSTMTAEEAQTMSVEPVRDSSAGATQVARATFHNWRPHYRWWPGAEERIAKRAQHMVLAPDDDANAKIKRIVEDERFEPRERRRA